MNMNVVNGFPLAEIKRWAKQHLQADSVVVSDGSPCFLAVKDSGCEHIRM